MMIVMVATVVLMMMTAVIDLFHIARDCCCRTLPRFELGQHNSCDKLLQCVVNSVLGKVDWV